MVKQKKKLKEVLERLYSKYNHRDFIKPDPLQFVYQYSDPADMEIAGFLAAELAYGRVNQIEKSVANLLGRMGNSPFEFVRNFDKKGRDVRLVGVKVSNLIPADFPDSLFNDGIDQKREKLHKAIDAIKEKFGSRAIQRAGTSSLKKYR